MSLITWTLVLTGGDKDDDNDSESYKIFHRVTEKDNKLSVGQPFDGARSTDLQNVDTYSVQKELYLGGKCEVKDDPDHPWQFWMIMLKNGNMDTSAGLCPKDGKKVGPFPPESRFPCFSKGSCMNQPLVYHNYTAIEGDTTLKGGFYGTWDLDADVTKGLDNISYYSVTWEKEIGEGGWKFHHVLKTSPKYPWLMLYLRSDATKGYSGGYHYPTRGMTKIVRNTHLLLFLLRYYHLLILHFSLSVLPLHLLLYPYNSILYD